MALVADLVALLVLTTAIPAKCPIEPLFRTNSVTYYSKVVGTCDIPWLTGSLYRVGPAQYEYGG